MFLLVPTCGLCCLGSPGGVVAGLFTPGGAGLTNGLSGVVVGVEGALLGLGIRGIPGFNCGLKYGKQILTSLINRYVKYFFFQYVKL